MSISNWSMNIKVLADVTKYQRHYAQVLSRISCFGDENLKKSSVWRNLC